MNKSGPVTKKWLSTRQEWIKQNPGPWSCYLCGKPLERADLQLDHVLSRARRPDLRFELSNLKPICARDNKLKGSLSVEEYKSKFLLA